MKFARYTIQKPLFNIILTHFNNQATLLSQYPPQIIFKKYLQILFLFANFISKSINLKMETISPNIFVNNIAATIKFYQTLGFKVTMSVPDEGPDYVWVMMTNGKVTFMFQTFESLADTLPEISRTDGGSLLLYINLKGIRGFFEEVKNKVTILAGLEKTFYGATEFSIKDNNGYVLTFAEHE
jgi:uncharacterized glyoxalase superfamily protein PhnB